MVQGRLKSRTFRRVKKVTPGARNVTHYEKRKPGKATCPVTGQELHGVPRDKPSKIKNMAKSEKRPERPYGGVLSSKAMREVMKERARKTKL
ncbi:MAG: 50S ribosomal protein L34e [Candidatus Woesearchaeota archaeon]